MTRRMRARASPAEMALGNQGWVSKRIVSILSDYRKKIYLLWTISINRWEKKKKLSLSLSIDREFTTIQYHIKKSFTIRYRAPWKDSNPGPRIVEIVYYRTMAQGDKVISFPGLLDNYSITKDVVFWISSKRGVSF